MLTYDAATYNGNASVSGVGVPLTVWPDMPIDYYAIQQSLNVDDNRAGTGDLMEFTNTAVDAQTTADLTTFPALLPADARTVNIGALLVAALVLYVVLR